MTLLHVSHGMSPRGVRQGCKHLLWQALQCHFRPFLKAVLMHSKHSKLAQQACVRQQLAGEHMLVGHHAGKAHSPCNWVVHLTV